MLYKERLQKLVESGDPFWIDAIDRFIEATYENKEQGISDLEELAKDRTRFNDFTKQIIQRKDDLKSVKAEFLEDIKNNYIKNINSIAIRKRTTAHHFFNFFNNNRSDVKIRVIF